jgi:hypothetical protein
VRSPRRALTPHKNRNPAIQRTTQPKGTSDRCLTIRKSEKGITQKATAALKLEARLSQVRNCGGVYALDRWSKIENTFAPKSQNKTTTRQKITKNPA